MEIKENQSLALLYNAGNMFIESSNMKLLTVVLNYGISQSEPSDPGATQVALADPEEIEKLIDNRDFISN